MGSSGIFNKLAVGQNLCVRYIESVAAAIGAIKMHISYLIDRCIQVLRFKRFQVSPKNCARTNFVCAQFKKVHRRMLVQLRESCLS